MCTHCGKEMSDQADFCTYCRHETMKNDANDLYEERPAPKWESNSLEEDMLVFVDQNQKYYEQCWNRMGDKRISRNLAAFFLSFGWIGYRKMYKNAAIVMLLLLVFDVILFNLFPADWADTIEPFIPLSIWVAYGMFGNYFYQNYARKKVQKIRRTAVNSEEKYRLLKKQGGRSWLGVVISFLLFLGIYVWPITTWPLVVVEEDQGVPPTLEDIESAEDIEWDTYENTRFGYIVNYPANWEQDEESPSNNGVSFYVKNQNEITIFAEVFDGKINRANTGVTEEVPTDDGHLAIVNRTDRGNVVTYHMSIVEDYIEYHLTASVTSAFAKEHEVLFKEMIRSFEITEGEEGGMPPTKKEEGT